MKKCENVGYFFRVDEIDKCPKYLYITDIFCSDCNKGKRSNSLFC